MLLKRTHTEIFSIGIGILSLLSGIAVVAGWALHIENLKSLIPGYLPMKFNVALCFIFLGIGILLYYLPVAKMPRLYVWAAVVPVVIGMVTFSQYIFNYDAGIDEFFFDDYLGKPYPGRMPPFGALSFAAAGFGLIYLPASNLLAQRITQYTLNVFTVLAVTLIIGHIYGVPTFYRLTFISTISLTGALLYFLVAITISLINPAIGLPSIFNGDKPGNLMARWFYPLMVLMVLILGYALLHARQLNMLSVDFSISLFAASVMLLGLILVWLTANRLNVMDVKRREAEQALSNTNTELKAANQYLEQLAFISSHDFKAPIITMDGLINMMVANKAIKDEHSEMLGMMRGVVQQMQKTNQSLNEILKLRKNLINRTGQENETVAWDNVLTDVNAMLLPDLEAAGGTLQVNLNGVTHVKFPYVYLKSVLGNILGNAIKYRDIHRGLVIKLETRKLSNGRTAICISDNGMGIDLKRNKDKLFGIFKRFHKSGDGAGVGLHITKSIIEAYGGTITAESEVGKGTTFTIII